MHETRKRCLIRRCTSRLAASLLIAIGAAPALAQRTWRTSVQTGDQQANGHSTMASLSADGRFVAFASAATDMVILDTNGATDVFVHDRLLLTTTRVSVDSSGAESNGFSSAPVISPDGRFVTFFSAASNLVEGDTNGMFDVFVHDLQTGETVRASLANDGAEGDANSVDPSISADGRAVAFTSNATNLVAGDTNGASDVFVRDLELGTTVRVSVATDGTQAELGCNQASVSADGRYVAFQSPASALVSDDTNGLPDVFVRELANATTFRVSVATGGAQSTSGASSFPSLSPDGRYVAFQSEADDLAPGDTNGVSDVFVHEIPSVTTVRASLAFDGSQGAGASERASISADGRYVAFESDAANLIADDQNQRRDVFRRDLGGETTVRASMGAAAKEPGDNCTGASISSDGQIVAFQSSSSFLVPEGDTNGVIDVFVRDTGPVFAPFCYPSENEVIPCPCNNEPIEIGMGCENFGIGPVGSCRLTSTGIPSLSNDTLVLVSTGENDTSLTIFLQSPAVETEGKTGIPFGAGIRCIVGPLRRLYSGSAVNGAISRPGVGGISVHLRSQTLGDPIPSGATRFYMVYYRDPGAAAACGVATSTFNSSNAGSLVWLP